MHSFFDLRRTVAVLIGSGAGLLMAGCGGFQSGSATAAPPAIVTAKLQGASYSGRAPISGASIQLWQTGTADYGSGASTNASVIGATTTNPDGTFAIASFNCTSGTQLYITSTGGNPGDGVNSIAVLMSGLTSCVNIASVTKVNIDEVTTVASAYALDAFASTGQSFTSSVQIGAPGTNQTGLANAKGDVTTLVSLPNGLALTGSSGVTLPNAEIDTIANAVAACVNSAGASSLPCNMLFADASDANGNAPIDTLAAALNIARTAGGSHVADLVAMGGSTVPFTPVLSATPNDLTLGITYTGSAISAPTGLAVDAGGNVWIANSTSSAGTGSVSELTHTGANCARCRSTYFAAYSRHALRTATGLFSAWPRWIAPFA